MTWLWVMPGSALDGLAHNWRSGFASQRISAVKAFLPTLESMTGSGPVTLEKVQAPQYGADAKRAPA
jgi:hypothetical protein